MSREQNPDFPGWEELRDFTLRLAVQQAASVCRTAGLPMNNLKPSRVREAIEQHPLQWTEEFTDEVLWRMELYEYFSSTAWFG